MTVITGKFHHEDGSYDLALADNTGGEQGREFPTVVRFPEGSGGKEVEHDVKQGSGGGEFST